MRLKPIAAGLVLFAAYFSLSSAATFGGQHGLAFHLVGRREGMFWLAHWGLATPGLLMVAYGLAPILGEPLRRCWQALVSPRRGSLRLAAIGYAVLLMALALAGRHYLLLDLAVTDDENAVAFGGRMIAEGHLKVPTPQPAEALDLLFVFERDGLTSSMDFPGGLLFDALSRVSGLGGLLYALLVAVSGVALAWGGGLLGGRAGALVTAFLWLVSPMIVVLSMTHHSHLVSRSWLALALPCYLYLVLESGPRRTLAGFLLGFFAGLAFLTRPVEAVCLLTPVALHLGGLARRWQEFRRPLLTAAMAWAAIALLFAWYNHQITGSWFLQARFADGASSHTGQNLELGQRLGQNLGFNIVMLGVFLLGPLAPLLAWLSFTRHRAIASTLAWGVTLNLLIALAHDDTGVHLVGPIHYSEAAIPLILLASLGLLELFNRRLPTRAARATALCLVTAYGFGLVLFTAVHGQSLRAQAEIAAIPLRALDQIEARPALVIAEPLHLLWEKRPDLLADVRSGPLRFPHPDPWLRDDVLVVYPSIEPPRLFGHFPDRAYYHLTYQKTGPPVAIKRLQWANPPTGGDPGGS